MLVRLRLLVGMRRFEGTSIFPWQEKCFAYLFPIPLSCFAYLFPIPLSCFAYLFPIPLSLACLKKWKKYGNLLHILRLLLQKRFLYRKTEMALCNKKS